MYRVPDSGASNNKETHQVSTTTESPESVIAHDGDDDHAETLSGTVSKTPSIPMMASTEPNRPEWTPATTTSDSTPPQQSATSVKYGELASMKAPRRSATLEWYVEEPLSSGPWKPSPIPTIPGGISFHAMSGIPHASARTPSAFVVTRPFDIASDAFILVENSNTSSSYMDSLVSSTIASENTTQNSSLHSLPDQIHDLQTDQQPPVEKHSKEEQFSDSELAVRDLKAHMLIYNHLDDGLLKAVEQNRVTDTTDAESLRSSILADQTTPQTLSSPTTMRSRIYNSNSDSELSFVEEGEVSMLVSHIMEEIDGPTQDLVTKLAWRIEQQYTAYWKQAGSSTCAQSQGESSSSASHSSAKDSPATSQLPSLKRSRRDKGNDDNLEESHDDDDQVPNTKRRRTGESEPEKLFACPFTKFDPQRYSDRNHNNAEGKYRNCSSILLRSIPRVKQHLYRTHRRPSWYCGNCYKIFERREQLNNHNRERPPCEGCVAKYEETMTDEQYGEIKRRTLGSMPSESWYRMFSILFPLAQKPASPYSSTVDSSTVQHFVNFFRWYGPAELLDLMRDRRELSGGSDQIAASTQVIVDEAFEIALPESLRQMNQNATDESEPNSATSYGQHLQVTPTEPTDGHAGRQHQLVESSASQTQLMLLETITVRDNAQQDMVGPTWGNALPQPTDNIHPDLSPDPNEQQLWLGDPFEISEAFQAYGPGTGLSFEEAWNAPSPF